MSQSKINLKNFFGRRKGKALTNKSALRFDTVLPDISINIDEKMLADENYTIDLDSNFPSSSGKIWLEVGFGGGEHMVKQAINNPDVAIIGSEPYLNGIAKLLRQIEENDVKNIKIFNNDARILMDKLPDACIDKGFLLFADPWRKYKHRYRRFVNTDNLDRFARILKDDAILRIATDDPTYLKWILIWAPFHKSFEWVHSGPKDWFTKPADWYDTRYELKAIKSGRKPAYLSFKRKKRQQQAD